MFTQSRLFRLIIDEVEKTLMLVDLEVARATRPGAGRRCPRRDLCDDRSGISPKRRDDSAGHRRARPRRAISEPKRPPHPQAGSPQCCRHCPDRADPRPFARRAAPATHGRASWSPCCSPSTALRQGSAGRAEAGQTGEQRKRPSAPSRRSTITLRRPSLRMFYTQVAPKRRPRDLPQVFELLVGERGFEPPAPASRRQCSTRLSYSPTAAAI